MRSFLSADSTNPLRWTSALKGTHGAWFSGPKLRVRAPSEPDVDLGARARPNSSNSSKACEEIATFLKKQNQRPREESLLTVKEVASSSASFQHAVYGWAEGGEQASSMNTTAPH